MAIGRLSLAAVFPLFMALVVSASPMQLNARQDGNTTLPADNTTLPAENTTLPVDNTTMPVDGSTAPAENTTIHAPGSAASDWVHQGCFTDTAERVLKQANFSSVAMTYDNCAATCFGQNATVAGVESGNQCYCGSEIPSISVKAADRDCNMPCAGAGEVMCGGTWKMNVFALAGSPQAPAISDTQENDIDANSYAALDNGTTLANETAGANDTTLTNDTSVLITTTQDGVVMTVTDTDGQQAVETTANLMTETIPVTSTAADGSVVTTVMTQTMQQPAEPTDGPTTQETVMTTTDVNGSVTTSTATTVIDPAPTGNSTEVDPAALAVNTTLNETAPAAPTGDGAEVITLPGGEVTTTVIFTSTHTDSSVMTHTATATVARDPITVTIASSATETATIPSDTAPVVKKRIFDSLLSAVSELNEANGAVETASTFSDLLSVDFR